MHSSNEFDYYTFFSYWIQYARIYLCEKEKNKKINVWPYSRKRGNIMRGLIFVDVAYIFFIFHIFCIFELLDFWKILLLDFTISHVLHCWTFRFLNNSIIGCYYYTSFGFMNFWILVLSLVNCLLWLLML